MKNTILYTLFCLIGVLSVNAQNNFELTIDSPTVVAGEDLIISYTYSSTEDGRITFSINFLKKINNHLLKFYYHF